MNTRAWRYVLAGFRSRSDLVQISISAMRYGLTTDWVEHVKENRNLNKAVLNFAGYFKSHPLGLGDGVEHLW